ncbi:uncharacterized protein LACBIDRAFT_313361 [Laccaria bicolor S238N-H82]|uniref:Predicted protein n=1 Tax=Laccaria bicolor (strain S238N-H82 / ATCC MYA-4686) TaxID=486041 RepID=B0DY58_LACBS|nr:uncharacterized protein LACBIDRAFT_313361 [Laccaria bicolor S238N-H82]EDR00502.1 predicted protein [Laccaria bicolor S238N-H82]|eukprot:XP_001888894.1 predicted protein [Laccaria bicolor S238N-H82]
MPFLRCTLEVVLDDLGGIGLWEPLVHPGLNLLIRLTRMEVVLGRASCGTWSIEVLCATVLSGWTTYSRFYFFSPHPLTHSSASCLFNGRFDSCPARVFSPRYGPGVVLLSRRLGGI